MFEQQKNYLTKEWYEKLIQELHDLKTIKLPAILERLKDAQSQWDLSENFDYDVNRTEKEFAESRISEIDYMLKNVEIIEGSKWVVSKDQPISFGSKVTIEDDKWERSKVIIVGGAEVDYNRSFDKENQVQIDKSDYLMMSFDSPIGIAIRGKKSWDKVRVRLANGRQDMKIIEVK